VLIPTFYRFPKPVAVPETVFGNRLPLFVIPAKAGIQCLQAGEYGGAGFLLAQE
jgi:hypothetical protein